MKCPHCGYIHGWDGEKMEDIEGSAGNFYSLPVEMRRQNRWDDRL